jgi:hypothetical protein
MPERVSKVIRVPVKTMNGYTGRCKAAVRETLGSLVVLRWLYRSVGLAGTVLGYVNRYHFPSDFREDAFGSRHLILRIATIPTK